MTALRATYRLQLRAGVTLARARSLAPYLEELGVSHLYLSPVLRARRGSTHGYDVVDPTRVDAALGGESALARLASGLRARGLAILLDVVPNHMAADPQGPFFDDLLRRGRASPTASWFDVDWNAPGCGGRLLLPALGDSLARCLARGELRLKRGRGGARVHYFDRSYPIDPGTLPPALAEALSSRRPRAADAALRRFAAGQEGRRRLSRLLGAQAYRLEHWRSASRRLNYRRFFDVNELVSLRAEDPEVFAATHEAVLGFVSRGWIDGLRVDHVDGILDPASYLGRLDAALRDARPGGGARERPVLLVEKILAQGEELPRSWPVDGTTGYEFLNRVESALLDPGGAAAIEAHWTRLAGGAPPFEATAREARRRVLQTLLEADARRLARRLEGLLAAETGAPALRERELRAALVELIAELDVYRVYPDAGRLADADRRRLAEALSRARRSARAPRAALDRLGAVLLAERAAPALATFRQQFQQLSAPAAAKGVEDTAFYRHTPLLSRNEVGGEPGAPLEDAVAELHRANAERARHWPRSLLAATTHDTKRSADVRARLDVLSELPDAWAAALSRWRRWNAPLRRRVGSRRWPDAPTELLLYQTLLGVWPLSPKGAPIDGRQLPALRRRVEAFMEKACREAKRHTGWTDPDAAYEKAVREFSGALLSRARPEGRRFLADLDAFAGEVARPGLWNALARTVVQLSAPGVPDLYQGDEVWNFALVDPDNRRPVDFAALRRRLARIEAAFAGGERRRAAFVRGLLENAEDGSIKLHVVRAALQARRRAGELFAAGDYAPLAVRGARAEHVFAFARSAGSRVAVAAVTRLPRTMVDDPERPPVGADVWGDTWLSLPHGPGRGPLRSVLSGARIEPGGRNSSGPGVPVATLFADLPVALLIR